MGSPLGLITKVHNVGEDGGGKKDQKAVKFSLLSKFLLDDLVWGCQHFHSATEGSV